MPRLDGINREPKTIRMRKDLYEAAQIAAALEKKSLGQWLEEAIQERIKEKSI